MADFIMPEGLTYVGPNEYRSASALAGLPAIMLDDREVVFDAHKKAAVAPAAVKRAGATPDLVGGRATKKMRYDWPVFRETVTTRAMTGGLTPADALIMEQRIARGVEKMLASAFTTGTITWDDGEVIDIWTAEGASPYMTVANVWTGASGDPLADILAAADMMVTNGARPAKRLLLGSTAAAASGRGRR